MIKKVRSSWFVARRVLVIIGAFVAYCYLMTAAYAKEITILYTGDTHAMLYPCSCPKEPDGGIARRATLVKQLKKSNPDTLLLDTGEFFAGGVMDEYAQDSIFDKERTLIALKAMNIMRYDAVAIGSDEFDFGREFLKDSIAKSNFAFLSSNISGSLENPDKILPYIIKEIGGLKFGIIGLTNPSVVKKTVGLKLIEPKTALNNAIKELKEKQVDVIIVLSNAGESSSLSLLENTQGVNILIIGHSDPKREPSESMNSTLILRPSWQGRKLGKLTITIADRKIKNYKTEELRLSDKIKDDPEVSAILPRCFSDVNCKNGAFIGTCKNPGKLNASCEFPKASKVNLLVISPKNCDICDTKTVIDYLKAQIPGLAVSYLYYPGAKAEKLIKDSSITGLPAYLVGKEIEGEQAFSNLKDKVYAKGEFYIVKPEVGGISYFLNRTNMKGNLDLFISLYGKNVVESLGVVKDFKPNVHFLATWQANSGFDAAGGSIEVEECLRAVCVEKHYPQVFWDYITCRAKNISSSWWEDCLNSFDPLKIKVCAKGQEGAELLKNNIKLNKETKILFGPTYLVDNQLVFGTQGVPTKEELKRILKR